ncbi:hypothetical protein CISIN_1g034376mg [Citrus sinensis]|uniref:C-JID domain-containing protein n=1 Tax=Citrus sinensis TaxID=2711 RepID=A0A067DK00_CITSI|nr:hypothetical protein CISIN_1g034376mg [Citrus sinensis]
MYQNEGSSITVTRPSYLYNTNKVVGYAICSVFHVPKHSLWRSNMNESHHNFVGTNMEVATKSKRSLAENGVAAEASGSGCCDDDDEPPRKRFKQLK